MRKIYVLEVNCKIVSAYESKEAAIMAGLARYTNWLNSYNDSHDVEFSSQQIVEDLQSLINHNYIEDYIYISEIPLFFVGDYEE